MRFLQKTQIPTTGGSPQARRLIPQRRFQDPFQLFNHDEDETESDFHTATLQGLSNSLVGGVVALRARAAQRLCQPDSFLLLCGGDPGPLGDVLRRVPTAAA